MGFIKYSLLILVVIICARIYYLFFRTKKKEGFESLTNCLNQGYPDAFCHRLPLEACITNCPLGNFKEKVFKVFS